MSRASRENFSARSPDAHTIRMRFASNMPRYQTTFHFVVSSELWVGTICSPARNRWLGESTAIQRTLRVPTVSNPTITLVRRVSEPFESSDHRSAFRGSENGLNVHMVATR